MKLPEVQIELREIAARISAVAPADAARIDVLAGEISRRASHRSPATSVRMTPAIAAQARHMASTTTLTQHEIAERLGVNPGRVSEALRGKRA